MNAEISRESKSPGSGRANPAVVNGDLSIDARWRAALADLDLLDAELLQARRERPHQRTYLSGQLIYKMHLLGSGPGHADRADRADRLRRGFHVVRSCADIASVPRAEWECRQAGVQVCTYAAIPGARRIDSPDLGTVQAVTGMMRLAWVLCRLSWRGMAHNDLFPSNVVIGADGNCYLLDFDSATLESRVMAFWRNFVQGRRKKRDGRPKWAFARLATTLFIGRLARWVTKLRSKRG